MIYVDKDPIPIFTFVRLLFLLAFPLLGSVRCQIPFFALCCILLFPITHFIIESSVRVTRSCTHPTINNQISEGHNQT